MVFNLFMMQKDYNLINLEHGGKEIKLMSSSIKDVSDEKLYTVKEPELDKRVIDILPKIKQNTKFPSKEINFYDFLKKIKLSSKNTETELSDLEKTYVKYYLFRNLFGLGELEPLAIDPKIKYILCEGLGKPVKIFHEDYAEPIQTSIVFKSKNKLDSIINHLLEKTEKIDSTKPNVNGKIKNFAVSINPVRQTFTLNKNYDGTINPQELVISKFVSKNQITYLSKCIKNGFSILIVAPKKTNTNFILSRLGSLIEKEKIILSLEETPSLCFKNKWISKTYLEDISRISSEKFDAFVCSNPGKRLNEITKIEKQKIITITHDKDLNSFFEDFDFPRTAIDRFDIVIDLQEKIPVGKISRISEVLKYDFINEEIITNDMTSGNLSKSRLI